MFLAKEHEFCASLAGHAFVVLGAGANMGPFEVLMKLGATVVAVDLDRPHVWERLHAIARDSPGTMYYPTRKGSECPGCNLLTDFPAVANWLGALLPELSFTVGNYAYMDGANFIRLNLAMDAISDFCIKTRATATSLAYLCVKDASPPAARRRTRPRRRTARANVFLLLRRAVSGHPRPRL